MTAAESTGGADRISALPVEIKISILSLVNVKDAIRTSALARSWRHIWTLLPCLHLGLGLGLHNLGLRLLPNGLTVSSDWIERAHHLVSSLRGPLILFELNHCFTSDQAPLIQRLLNLLLQKGGVQTLYLTCQYDRLLVHLPPFHSLKALRLRNCRVVLPIGFQGFNTLATLELERVDISNDHLHFLIHTSNNLTTFSGSEFLVSEDPLSVSITSPLLRHLTFDIDDPVNKVSVVSAPCLEQVKIAAFYCTDYVSKKLAPVVLGLLISVSMVSSLNLEYGVLKLKYFYYSDEDSWVEILKEGLHGKKRDGISCLNQILTSVTINTSHAMIGITLGKFFLLNAKVLKLMKFQCLTRSIVKPGMIEELHKLEATSSYAKVVVFCQQENVTINIK